jgi:Protein of unknown function (DUF2550)
LAAGSLALGAELIHLAIPAVVVVLVFLAAVGVCTVSIAARRSLIERAGSVDCGLRRGPGGRWQLGLAEYGPDELRWHPVFGVRLRPSVVFARRALSVVSRRPAGPAEAAGIVPGTVVVECDTDEGRIQLALSEDALTGFLAWLEAAPPGPGVGYG